MVRDRSFNYRYFDKSYLFHKELWRPDKERELIEGYDIGKIITKNVRFEVSHSDILLQAADVAANLIRRILNEVITDKDVARNIGKLLIKRKRGNLDQSVDVITLSYERSSDEPGIGQMLGIMSRAGRSMIKPSSRTTPA